MSGSQRIRTLDKPTGPQFLLIVLPFLRVSTVVSLSFASRHFCQRSGLFRFLRFLFLPLNRYRHQ